MKRIGKKWLHQDNVLGLFAQWLLEVPYRKIYQKIFIQEWLRKTIDGYQFNFKGALLPDVSRDPALMNMLLGIFEDIFLIPCRFNDNYDKLIVERIDRYTNQGAYGYKDGVFDVTVKAGDVVIDAGAWIGDFSAYAASKKSFCYAFEPVAETFAILNEAAKLNGSKIYPVQKGLGLNDSQLPIYIAKSSLNNSTALDRGGIQEMISITSLDNFQKENCLERIDFIKADIEGAERDMLQGAAHILKDFAPKLAICTYHRPDDPAEIEEIILNANSNYTIKHFRHMLYATLIK
jgi:FkbM family methyltransferase